METINKPLSCLVAAAIAGLLFLATFSGIVLVAALFW
jgi:hypothetical protein